MTADLMMKKCAYLLADRHLNELPKDIIISSSPRHYGLEFNDDHKLFMWNSLVDHYLLLPEGTLWQLFNKHVVYGEPIVTPLLSEVEEMVAYHTNGVLLLEEIEKLALVLPSKEGKS